MGGQEGRLEKVSVILWGWESGRKEKLLQTFYYRSEDEIGGIGTGGAEGEVKR